MKQQRFPAPSDADGYTKLASQKAKDPFWSITAMDVIMMSMMAMLVVVIVIGALAFAMNCPVCPAADSQHSGEVSGE